MISAPLFCRHFVGRRDELSFIMERFAECRAGRGSLVLLGGEAGGGKTRLLAELRPRLEKLGAHFLAGGCLEHAHAPLAPLAELLRDAGLAQSGVLRSAPELRIGLSRLLPETGGDGEPDALPIASDARGQFTAIRETLARIAASAPVVAAIEDAHWADLATLDCLQFLAERVSASRLLVLVTYRSEELHRGHPLALTLSRIRPAPSIWRLALGPLSDLEMQALQRDALAGQATLPAATLREIRALAEGNPLFTEELLRHAAELRGSDRELPLTVRATVLERLVHLPDEQRDVLVHAAVFGRRFEPGVLADVMGRPIEAIGAALRRARDFQLIVEQRNPSPRYAFRHALVREALYDELLPHERQPLHRRFAQRLEAQADAADWLTDLAYHWWSARDAGKALEYSERAGDAANGLLAYKDAAQHFERALEFAAPGARRAELNTKLGTTLGLAGDPRRARAAIADAAAFFEGAGETAKAGGLCRQIGWLYWVVGDTADARSWFERSRELARAAPDDPIAYNALVNIAMFHISGGDDAAACPYLAEAEAFAGTPQPSDVSVFFDARAQLQSLRGHIGQLVSDARSGIEAARRAGDVHRMINGHINLARAAASSGELEIARRACDDAVRLAREGFVAQREFLALVNRSLVELLAGEYTTARATIAEAMELGGDLDPALVLLQLGDYAIPLGLRMQDDELIRYFAQPETLELAFRSRESIRIAPMSAAFVELALTTGDAAGARDLLHRALAAVTSAEPAPGLLLLAAAHAGEADAARARALLERWAAPADNRGGRAFLALFDTYRASRSGDSRQARCARDAAAAFNVLRLPYYEALALELERKPERALEIYARIGDRRDAARVERELQNRRGRRREQLTQRERDIAGLVAQGKSNAEIAAHFVLSHRTVENHVSSILHKLTLRSRTELALHVSVLEQTSTP